MVDDFTQVIAALDLVFDLPEDLPNFVFDGVRAGGLLRETVQIGEELLIDEIADVIASQCLVVV